MTDLKELAKRCGFAAAEATDPAKLEFLPEVREMCAADRCQHYNKSWSCPPACGTLEEWSEKAKRYKKGLVVQTIGDIEDSFDFEAMMDIAKAHGDNIVKLADALADTGLDCLVMGAGACTRCSKCTYPDAPCRFPDKCFPSMEACGLNVSAVCVSSGIPYNYGPKKQAYTGCVLYNE